MSGSSGNEPGLGGRQPSSADLPSLGGAAGQKHSLDVFFNRGESLEARRRAFESLKLQEMNDERFELTKSVIMGNKKGEIGKGDYSPRMVLPVIRSLPLAPQRYHEGLIGFLKKELIENKSQYTSTTRIAMIDSLGDFSPDNWEVFKDPDDLDKLSKSSSIAGEAIIEILGAEKKSEATRVRLIRALAKTQDIKGQVAFESIAQDFLKKETDKVSESEGYAMYLHCVENRPFVDKIRSKYRKLGTIPTSRLYPLFCMDPSYDDVELFMKSEGWQGVDYHSPDNSLIFALELFLLNDELRINEGISDLETNEKADALRDNLQNILTELGEEGGNFAYIMRYRIHLGYLWYPVYRGPSCERALKEFYKGLRKKLAPELKNAYAWSWIND